MTASRTNPRLYPCIGWDDNPNKWTLIPDPKLCVYVSDTLLPNGPRLPPLRAPVCNSVKSIAMALGIRRLLLCVWLEQVLDLFMRRDGWQNRGSFRPELSSSFLHTLSFCQFQNFLQQKPSGIRWKNRSLKRKRNGWNKWREGRTFDNFAVHSAIKSTLHAGYSIFCQQKNPHSFVPIHERRKLYFEQTVV